MPVAAAVIGAGVLGAGASIYAGSQAANAQRDAAAQANAAQERMFNKQVELQAPFREAGLTAQNQYLNLLGLGKDTGMGGYGKYAQDFGMSDFTADPGYQFRLEEGQRALDRSAAARGGLQSGSALKAAARFGQDLGSQEYQNAFNRYQVNRLNQLNPLQSLMGAGQSSTNTLTGAAANYGNQQAQNAYNVGNARSSMYANTGNAITHAMSGIGNYFAYGGGGLGGGGGGPTWSDSGLPAIY